MSLEICRICGSNESLKHVFEEGSEELLDQIRICANIHIDAFDGLPKFVCTDCENGLAFSYRLRKRGEETERKLRQELLVSDDKHENTDVLEENILEDLHNNQSWIEDDEGFCFSESAEGFLVNADDVSVQDVEHIETSDQYDQSEEWISIDNAEIIERSDVEKIVNDSIELVYLSNDVSNNEESTANESPTSKKPKKTQIDCETCGEVFETKTKYGEHIKVHGDKRFHCDVCDKWFSARYRFDQHMKNHSSKKAAYPCDKCSKSFTIQWNLERHVRSVHNGEKRFQCAECGESFGRTDVLKMHMAKHSNERNIECEICQKKFKTLQHLHYHKKIHLAKSERPKKPARLKQKPKCSKIQIFMCEFCDKISHHRTTHLNHLRTHTGEKPFICATCNKAFRTTHARSKHMLLHTDERPHDCKLCGMSFRQTAHLKSHMLIHAGIKRHVCEFCQKAFTMKNNLMVHIRTHTGEMPYKCNQCPQKFLQLSKAKRHKMSHMMSEGDFPEDVIDETPNEVEADFNDSQISMYIDDIIEINQIDSDVAVISDCVIEEC